MNLSQALKVVFLTAAAAVASGEALSQELPAWQTFEWDNTGEFFNGYGEYCAQIPFPPIGWLPDCSVRETESGDFLIYNQLMYEHEAFGYEPPPRPPTIVDKNYLAFRA